MIEIKTSRKQAHLLNTLKNNNNKKKETLYIGKNVVNPNKHFFIIIFVQKHILWVFYEAILKGSHDLCLEYK